ncbi:MAG: hypothetical protein A2Y90_02450 [Chloroflexi bacterium RBG_13_52_12]|nr:MAG: hypothetical protein A2Y90_02450 [Chloroflexi bacterium RBG_13_52_12]
MAQKNQTIYEQDCEGFRYQDKLFWSRFQTLSVIEGALIWVTFWGELVDPIQHAISIGASLIILIVCLAALKDQQDAKIFLDRMDEYEKYLKVTPIRPKKLLKLIDGILISRTVTGLVTLFNIFIILCSYNVIDP